tara:strand:+ start:325 stop:489 length:165 start_codon:yes stop_codon:yes gene_type:complete
LKIKIKSPRRIGRRKRRLMKVEKLIQMITTLRKRRTPLKQISSSRRKLTGLKPT